MDKFEPSEERVLQMLREINPESFDKRTLMFSKACALYMEERITEQHFIGERK